MRSNEQSLEVMEDKNIIMEMVASRWSKAGLQKILGSRSSFEETDRRRKPLFTSGSHEVVLVSVCNIDIFAKYIIFIAYFNANIIDINAKYIIFANFIDINAKYIVAYLKKPIFTSGSHI